MFSFETNVIFEIKQFTVCSSLFVAGDEVREDKVGKTESKTRLELRMFLLTSSKTHFSCIKLSYMIMCARIMAYLLFRESLSDKSEDT